MLELSENKCLAVLRAKAQREVPAGHTEANIAIKFASGHSQLPSLPVVKLYFLTWVPL